MKIVYYSSGVTGSGRLGPGISLYNAFKRNNVPVDYTMITHCPMGYLAEDMGIDHIQLPVENEYQLSPEHYHESILYHTITTINPDMLVVYLQWFTLAEFIDELPCIKVFLARQVSPSFFFIETEKKKYAFQPQTYHTCFAIEPVDFSFSTIQVNPLIMRNSDEIYPEATAREKLKAVPHQKLCLISINGNSGEFEQVYQEYSQKLPAGYALVSTTNYDTSGIFPVVDYYNAFDLVISGAGYNSFWETRYFQKQTEYVPFERMFEDQWRRPRLFSDHTFKENGADQLLKMLLNM